jgi:hypothetical protein
MRSRRDRRTTFRRAVGLLAVPGVWPILEHAWRLLFRRHLRPLTAEEIAASLAVHGPSLIPYARVRVHERSPISWIASRNTGAATAVATGRVIHLPPGLTPLSVMVHELTHVLQYERRGPIYMHDALLAQQTAGYDYGDVRGKPFSAFNPEQQGALCEDYYVALLGDATRYGATQEELERLIGQCRAGHV